MGSFVGSCPAAPNGGSATTTPSSGLSGAVTVCRVSGSASAPVLTEVLVGVDQVAAYLNQNPGSILGSCPAKAGGNATGQSGAPAGPVSAVVTVCRVTGSVDAPVLAQLNLTVEEVAAFIARSPGSFIGTCPGKGGSVTQGPGRILGIPVGSALTICRVSSSGNVLQLVQENVAIERVAAFLRARTRTPSSGSAGPRATRTARIGDEPLGYVTICRVTGLAGTPLAAVTIRLDELEAYLARAGTVLSPGAAGCPRVTSQQDDPNHPPTEAPVGKPTTVVVHTTPNTVVTAKGAGVNQSTTSDKKGKAKLTVKPKRPGLVTVRSTAGRAAMTLGATSPKRSGGNLTG